MLHKHLKLQSKRMRVLALISVLVVAFAVFRQGTMVSAQSNFTPQDAIDTAAAHPVFEDGLSRYEGWSAAAYDTGNVYGIWRVQFWDSAGEEVGWADVNPASGQVYTYEAYFAASEDQINDAYGILRDFTNNAPEILELVEDPSQYEIYVDFDGWNRWWGVYLDIGEDSLYFTVDFDGETPNDLENPELRRLYFANVLTYAEWQDSMGSQAVLVAFQNQEISNAVNGHEWTTEVEQIDGGRWRVIFWEADVSLAEVILDAEMQSIVDYTLKG